jgi:hypothetical protein
MSKAPHASWPLFLGFAAYYLGGLALIVGAAWIITWALS